MQVKGTKCAIVALNIFALGEYGNKMSASTNSTKSRNFEDIKRPHYRSSVLFWDVPSRYSKYNEVFEN